MRTLKSEFKALDAIADSRGNRVEAIVEANAEALYALKQLFSLLESADCELCDGRDEGDDNIPLIEAHLQVVALYDELKKIGIGEAAKSS